jgi:predicted anti-sigma-YlaC factor YlaD
MMTCKDVSLTISTGDLDTARVPTKMAVWMHLAMCRHCRAFRRQLKAIGLAARRIADAFEREPSPDFERTIVKRLSR